MIQCLGYTKKRIIRHSVRLCNSHSEVAEWDNKGSSDRTFPMRFATLTASSDVAFSPFCCARRLFIAGRRVSKVCL